MSEWVEATLIDLADVRTSNVDKKFYPQQQNVRLCNYMDVYSNDYITPDLEFMSSTATRAEIEKFRVLEGDVIITKDSETPFDIGIPAAVKHDIPDLVCGYHLALLRPRSNEIDHVLLSKLLQLNETKSYLASVAAGSTRFGLSIGAIERTPVLYPSNPKRQKKIAAILETVDDAIERTEDMIGKYEQVKAGMMQDLFTRGLTPGGKLRPPRGEAPDMYKETPIGWIPEDWEVMPVKDCFSVQLGKMLSRVAKSGAEEFPYLGNKNVQWNRVDLQNLETMSFSAAEREKFQLRNGDLLMCEGGEIGRVAIWQEELQNCYYQKAIHRLRALTDDYNPPFYLRFFKFAKVAGMLTNFASQTSIAHLTREKLLTVPLPVPCSEEQNEIVDRLDGLDAQLGNLALELQKLRQQKHGLMHDLLTGTVPVKV